MTELKKQWTGQIHSDEQSDTDTMLNQLCQAFNNSPFLGHNGMSMRVVNHEIEGYMQMQPTLIGNMAFEILHGGVAATILDSIGGIVAMGELYKRGKADEINETFKKVARLATVDMRVDYLAPGRGEFFIAKAEVLRMGRKGCTMRMSMLNNLDVLIAVGVASYSY